MARLVSLTFTTMTSITPQQCREWIEFWSDKTLSLGCLVRSNGNTMKFSHKSSNVVYMIGKDDVLYHGWINFEDRDWAVIGHPLTTGRVFDLVISRDDRDKIILLWEMCGLLQAPLNTILEEAETETLMSCECEKGWIEDTEKHKNCWGAHWHDRQTILTGPAADLFRFLFEVLPIPNPSLHETD